MDAATGARKWCTATFVQAGTSIHDYRLYVTRAGTGSGAVIASPQGISCGIECGWYSSGQNVSLRAIPDAGSVFAGWSGDCSGTDERISVNMGAQKLCTATFDDQSAVLTVTLSGAGTGKVRAVGIDCGTDCTETFDQFNRGLSVSLVATPDSGSVFAGWGGDCSGYGTGQTAWAGMFEDKSCTAIFELPASFSLTVTKDGTGSGRVRTVIESGGNYQYVPGLDCGADCYEIYNPGTLVTLFASHDSGSIFRNWGGDCSGTDQYTTVTIDGVKSCVATFNVPVTRTLTVNVSGNGQVTETPFGRIDCGLDCSESYTIGTQVTLTATPDTGWQFNGWSGDCSGSSFTNDLTIQTDMNCTATFVNQPPTASFTFTPSAPESDEIVSFDASGSTDSDGSIVLYEWDFQYGGTTFNPDATGVNATHTYVTAVAATYTARLRVTDNGGLTDEISQQITVTAGTCCILTVDPTAGNATGVVYSEPIGISCGTFDGQSFTACTRIYSSGESLILHAQPSTGAGLTQWGAGDCDSVFGNQCTVTMDRNRTVRAFFD
jgi:hypothetical protein